MPSWGLPGQAVPSWQRSRRVSGRLPSSSRAAAIDIRNPDTIHKGIKATSTARGYRLICGAWMASPCTKGRSRRPRHRQTGLRAIPAKTFRASLEKVTPAYGILRHRHGSGKSYTDRRVLLFPAYPEASGGYPAAGRRGGLCPCGPTRTGPPGPSGARFSCHPRQRTRPMPAAERTPAGRRTVSRFLAFSGIRPPARTAARSSATSANCGLKRHGARAQSPRRLRATASGEGQPPEHGVEADDPADKEGAPGCSSSSVISPSAEADGPSGDFYG